MNFRTLAARAIVFAVASLFSSLSYSQSDVHTYLSKEMQQRQIPGMTVLVSQNGKILLKGAYGSSDLQLRVPMREDTLFQIASTTKIFTGISLALLEQERKLTLEDAAGQYLPDLPADWKTVTLKQMAAHISGLPDFIESPDAALSAAVLQRNEHDSLQFAESRPLLNKPGERFNYDQTNFLLLKEIIESVAGMGFEDFVRRRVFLPLGMSSCIWGDMRAIVPGRSSLYSTVSAFTYLPAGTLSNSVNPYVYPPFMSTAAGLNTKIEDLGKLGAALTESGLLNTAEQTRMWEFARHPDGKVVDIAKEMDIPGTTGPAIGWFRTERPGGRHPAVWMEGGSSTAFMYFPADKMTVVVLTNLQGADPLSLAEGVAAFYLGDLVKVL